LTIVLEGGIPAAAVEEQGVFLAAQRAKIKLYQQSGQSGVALRTYVP
jgi:hypothetical protein